MSKKTIEFDQPKLNGGFNTNLAWASVPEQKSFVERKSIKSNLKSLVKKKDAVVVAHYYVDSDIQDLAEETGGCVSDSLEMARFGRDHNAKILIVAGVRFMGETAKILSPEKTILMPDINATCSLDLGCPPKEFKKFCESHPERTVVVYANTSAEIKAMADWVVTSSVALEIISYLHKCGKKILWAPDRHLGNYIKNKTGADMISWNGSCIVHDEFKALELEILKEKHPEALTLVHPESPPDVIKLADVVGSTSKLIEATKSKNIQKFIVATDNGILHRMRSISPQKIFLEAPTSGNSATCKSCAYCPWMAMNVLQNITDTLLSSKNEIKVDYSVQKKAKQSINKMLDFAKNHATKKNKISENIFSGIGPA